MKDKSKAEKLSKSAFARKCWFKATEKLDQKIISRIRINKLKNKDFTIISNNCFAGWVYRRYNLPYLTPTVGLFIMPECYLKLLSNLHYYMKQDLVFINPEESKYKEYISSRDERFGKYPIAKIVDIEIHFLHYKDKEEAEEKWNRRKQRINWDKIIVKFSEQNGCTRKDIEDFYEKSYNNKICFVANRENAIKDSIYVKEFESNGFMVDDTWFATKYFNLTKFLNNSK